MVEKYVLLAYTYYSADCLVHIYAGVHTGANNECSMGAHVRASTTIHIFIQIYVWCLVISRLRSGSDPQGAEGQLCIECCSLVARVILPCCPNA